MHKLSDIGMRVFVAMATGAALIALATLANVYLVRGGLLDVLGSWRMLGSAALLCGECALAMEAGARLPARGGQRLVYALLAVSAIVWGVSASQATNAKEWANVSFALPWMALLGAAETLWLALIALLAGLLAGLRSSTVSATRAALTPLWLLPLWGGATGIIYGLLSALIYTPNPVGNHFYGLDRSPWDGLRAGLSIGIEGGLIVGATLALALCVALAVRLADASLRRRTLPDHPSTSSAEA